MSFSFFPAATKSLAQRAFPSDTNNYRAAPAPTITQSYPGIPVGTWYTEHVSSWTSADDGYAINPINIGWDWYFNGGAFSTCYVSTNGHINFGTPNTTTPFDFNNAASRIQGTTNGITAHYGDLWFDASLTNTTRYQVGPFSNSRAATNNPHKVWHTSYIINQQGTYHKVFRIIVYSGKFGAPGDLLSRTETGWRISLYKANQQQWIEVSLLDDKALNANSSQSAAGCGPYNNSGGLACAGSKNDPNYNVFYSPDAGNTWYNKGRGVVQLTGPAYYAYTGSSTTLTSAATKLMTIPNEYGDVNNATYNGDPLATAQTAAVKFNLSAGVTLLRLAAALPSRSAGELAFYIIAQKPGPYGYMLGDLTRSGAITDADATVILKEVVGNPLTISEQESLIALKNECLFNEQDTLGNFAVSGAGTNLSAAIAQYGLLDKAPARSVGSMSTAVFPGSSSGVGLDAGPVAGGGSGPGTAPTSAPISIGSYSGVGSTFGMSYNSTSYFGSSAYLFDTLWSFSGLTQADSSTTTLITTKYSQTAPVSYWYVQILSGQTEALSSFTIFWSGTNVGAPVGNISGSYPNQYYSNYQSYTSGPITYQKGVLQESTSDKFGVETKYYSVIYNYVINTF
jgi:hypothetical protein